MFISWGAQGKQVVAGSAGERHCGYCDKDSSFTRILNYTVRHVYWIFRWVTDRSAYIVCGNCGAAHAADDGDEALPEVRNAIPAMDRRGWLVGAGGIGAVIALGSLAAAADNSDNRTYLATPQVGDIYEADLAKMIENPEAPVMYGALRVTKVNGSEVEIEIARTWYNKLRGVDRDVNDGLARSESYYGPDRTTLPIAAMQRMYDEGTLRDVRR